MAKTAIELIHDLKALEGHVRQIQADLSHSYEAAENDSLDEDVLLDEASTALNACVGRIDDARLKVAAYEGLRQAAKGPVS